MKTWICKHKKALLGAAHLLIIPGALFFRFLSGQMLAVTTVCSWQRIGAKCPTCGGTHFVNALLSGRIWEALQHNAFLFLLTLFLGVSWIFLDLAVFGDVAFAKKALQRLYTIRTPVYWGVLMVLFVLLRNWRIWALLFQ